jgi:hypothetical protein
MVIHREMENNIFLSLQTPKTNPFLIFIFLLLDCKVKMKMKIFISKNYTLG